MKPSDKLLAILVSVILITTLANNFLLSAEYKKIDVNDRLPDYKTTSAQPYKLIGSTTAAADGNVSPIVLPGNIQTGISGIGVYYPDGRETQQVGIIPNIAVKPTIAGVAAGRDELLEKALEIASKP